MVALGGIWSPRGRSLIDVTMLATIISVAAALIHARAEVRSLRSQIITLDAKLSAHAEAAACEHDRERLPSSASAEAQLNSDRVWYEALRRSNGAHWGPWQRRCLSLSVLSESSYRMKAQQVALEFERIDTTNFTLPHRIPPTTHPGTVQRIPRVIRQSHKANFSALPNGYAVASRRWRTLNPDYLYEYYDDDAMRSYVAIQGHRIAFFDEAFRRATSGAMRCDLWRLLITWDLGGIYADMDTHAVKPLRTLINEDDDAVSGIGHGHTGVEQFVLAYSPRHPILYAALKIAVGNIMRMDDSNKNMRGYGAATTTGPAALHMAARIVLDLPSDVWMSSRLGTYWDATNTSSIRILKANYLCVNSSFPCSYGSTKYGGDINTFGGGVQFKFKGWGPGLDAKMGAKHYFMKP
jgi:hypothetical protein